MTSYVKVDAEKHPRVAQDFPYALVPRAVSPTMRGFVDEWRAETKHSLGIGGSTRLFLARNVTYNSLGVVKLTEAFDARPEARVYSKWKNEVLSTMYANQVSWFVPRVLQAFVVSNTKSGGVRGCMIIEMAEGGTMPLETRIPHPDLVVPSIARDMAMICDQVMSMHRHRMVHLDIKRANIVIRLFEQADGSLKRIPCLIDYGKAIVYAKDTPPTPDELINYSKDIEQLLSTIRKALRMNALYGPEIIEKFIERVSHNTSEGIDMTENLVFALRNLLFELGNTAQEKN